MNSQRLSSHLTWSEWQALAVRKNNFSSTVVKIPQLSTQDGLELMYKAIKQNLTFLRSIHYLKKCSIFL